MSINAYKSTDEFVRLEASMDPRAWTFFLLAFHEGAFQVARQLFHRHTTDDADYSLDPARPAPWMLQLTARVFRADSMEPHPLPREVIRAIFVLYDLLLRHDVDARVKYTPETITRGFVPFEAANMMGLPSDMELRRMRLVLDDGEHRNSNSGKNKELSAAKKSTQSVAAVGVQSRAFHLSSHCYKSAFDDPTYASQVHLPSPRIYYNACILPISLAHFEKTFNKQLKNIKGACLSLIDQCGVVGAICFLFVDLDDFVADFSNEKVCRVFPDYSPGFSSQTSEKPKFQNPPNYRRAISFIKNNIRAQVNKKGHFYYYFDHTFFYVLDGTNGEYITNQILSIPLRGMRTVD
jgi:hypothetical protein